MLYYTIKHYIRVYHVAVIGSLPPPPSWPGLDVAGIAGRRSGEEGRGRAGSGGAVRSLGGAAIYVFLFVVVFGCSVSTFPFVILCLICHSLLFAYNCLFICCEGVRRSCPVRSPGARRREGAARRSTRPEAHELSKGTVTSHSHSHSQTFEAPLEPFID